MAKQNIYDNDSFFENFKNLRNNKINFNDCIETPILLAMIPEVDGKRVLDIGCGMGQHAKQYSDMGAESVLGIDISEKCLSMQGTFPCKKYYLPTNGIGRYMSN